MTTTWKVFGAGTEPAGADDDAEDGGGDDDEREDCDDWCVDEDRAGALE